MPQQCTWTRHWGTPRGNFQQGARRKPRARASRGGKEAEPGGKQGLSISITGQEMEPCRAWGGGGEVGKRKRKKDSLVSKSTPQKSS